MAEVGETRVDDHTDVAALLGDEEKGGVGLLLETTPRHADA